MATVREPISMAKTDPRPGGAFSLVMTSPQASREVSGTYVEIDRPRKIRPRPSLIFADWIRGFLRKPRLPCCS